MFTISLFTGTETLHDLVPYVLIGYDTRTYCIPPSTSQCEISSIPEWTEYEGKCCQCDVIPFMIPVCNLTKSVFPSWRCMYSVRGESLVCILEGYLFLHTMAQKQTNLVSLVRNLLNGVLEGISSTSV